MTRPARRWAGPVLVALALLGVGASDSPLMITRWQLDVFNPDLTLDNGTASGFGNERARDLIPDGWWVEPNDGRIAVRSMMGPDGGRVARIVVAPDTEARLFTHRVTVNAGRTLVLRTRIRARPGANHAGTVTLRFVGESQLLGTAKRRVPHTEGEWEDFELRATAPPGTVAAAVSFNFYNQGEADRAWLEVGRLQLDGLRFESREPRPDIQRIFLVTLGSVRADHFDGYSRDATPTLDRLAREGTVFLQHSATSSRTPESLAALWTGRWPTNRGGEVDLWGLPDGSTASEGLESAGYVTGAFVAHNRLGSTRGFSRALHHFWQLESRVSSPRVNGSFLPWLASHRSDNLFAWVHYNEAERPFTPSEPWDTMFEGDETWRTDTLQLRPGPMVYEGRPVLPEPVAVRGQFSRRYYVARYDGGIAAADHGLKGLVVLLEQLDLVEGSLVVVTADHGVSLTEHARYFSTGSVYQHDLHVPLVFWGPGIVPAGRRIDVRSDHLDLLPTLLDYAGAPGREGPGRSLRPLIEGTSAELGRSWSVAVVGEGDHLRYGIRGPGAYKVITDARFEPQEIYDLATDPTEERDQIWRRRALAEEIAEGGRVWVESQPPP